MRHQPSHSGLRERGDRHPAKIPAAQHQRRDDERIRAGLAVEGPHRLRQARVVALVLDRLAPSRRVAEDMAPPCSPAAGRACPSRSRFGVYSRSRMYAIHRSHRCCSSSISHTPQAWSSPSSTIVFVNAPKNPSTSGSRTSRSRASCTTSDWIFTRHSARRRSAASRINAARSTSGSDDATSDGLTSPVSLPRTTNGCADPMPSSLSAPEFHDSPLRH